MFAWSDTCCVDKSSSCELDEAIRSMFRWYRNATICFVHFAQTTSLDDLHSDEWFDAASNQVLNKDWHPLVDGPNDKENQAILQLLSAATNCPEHALRQSAPEPFYVGRLMTRAARRKTTRGEDIAFSLTGIFDVTLQTAHGEGAERAFCRLIEKIMLSSGNTPVLNWAGKPASSHSSKAYPAFRRNYLGNPEYNSSRRLDTSMTSIGLRIPLLVLPLNKPRLLGRAKDGDLRLELSFSDERISSIADPITVSVLKGGFAKCQNWALGVYNYVPPYGMQVTGHLGIRPMFTAYLVSFREAPDGGDAPAQHGMGPKLICDSTGGGECQRRRLSVSLSSR
ncbi:hypothetical protein ACHAPT_012249 [Fusarium lateritium]